MFSFDEIVGNTLIIKNLKNAIRHNRVSHAYIINGGEGMGKKLMANSFAKALQCNDREEGFSCGHCNSCSVFDSGNHPDVIYVVPSKTKALGVDDIREQVIEKASTKQYKYRYKIFIIDKANTMTVQAQNALLKTLEEPPYYAVFLLLSDNIDGFLATILSRCVVCRLEPVPGELISNYLKNKKNISDGKAEIYGEYAQGSIGKAIQFANSEEFSNMREDVISKLISMNEKDIVSVMGMAKELEIYKESNEMLDMMYLWYRDLLVYKKLKNIKYLIQKDKKSQIISQTGREKLDSLNTKIEAVWNAKRQLSQNSNFQLTMEVLLIKLKES